MLGILFYFLALVVGGYHTRTLFHFALVSFRFCFCLIAVEYTAHSSHVLGFLRQQTDNFWSVDRSVGLYVLEDFERHGG